MIFDLFLTEILSYCSSDLMENFFNNQNHYISGILDLLISYPWEPLKKLDFIIDDKINTINLAEFENLQNEPHLFGNISRLKRQLHCLIVLIDFLGTPLKDF